MKLVEQVVSLELAKKLKELGFKQESVWMWFDVGLGYKLILKNRFTKKNAGISAFTVAELGEMLPRSITIEEKTSWIKIFKVFNTETNTNEWILRYDNDWDKENLVTICASPEANARAKMLIYLKEKGLI